jgi:hypothetical protein
MPQVVIGAFIGAMLLFWLIYAAVRMAVTDAMRRTLDPSVLAAEPQSDFRLDEGDDFEGTAASTLA